MAGPDNRQAVRLAGLEHDLPQLLGVAACAPAIDLEADLRRVARTGNDDVHPLEFVVPQVVIGDVEHAVAEQVDEDLPGLRSLNLHRADIGLADRHVKAGVVGDAHRPQEHVTVGDRDPEVILTQSEQHGIVDDPTVLCSNEDVLALPHRALVQVTRNEHVRERERVGAGDLHLPLDTDIPERDPV